MQESHGGLGALLRSWRDRLSPVDVGLPADDPRRAAGLRREELASLAGLSVDYVVRLEQGRAIRPSAQVAAALARALQLTDAERDHLFVVAGLLPPSPAEVPTHIPPGVQRLVARLGEVPLAVFTASWDLVTWSPLWAALLGEPTAVAGGRPNLLRTHFAGGALDGGRDRIVGRSGTADAFGASLVADLRRVHGRYPGDRDVRALIDDLLATSVAFRELWQSGAVGEHQSERKTVRNPFVGDLELDCDVFTVDGTDLRIVAYTAAIIHRCTTVINRAACTQTTFGIYPSYSHIVDGSPRLRPPFEIAAFRLRPTRGRDPIPGRARRSVASGGPLLHGSRIG